MKFLVSCAPGLEALLSDEIDELGITGAREPGPGVINIEMEWADAYTVMLESRIASRVLISLRNFAARNEAMLYDQIRRIDFTKLAQVAKTMAVFCHGKTEAFPLTFAALKIKDAVCDEYRKSYIDRPSVDRTAPDMRLEAFFNGGRCEVSMDLCGIPLHRRGYRDESGDAPLRENRAAALLRFAGFNGEQPMVDPFCGSGTIAIEAALVASRRAPGTMRPPEAFIVNKLYPDQVGAFRAAWQKSKAKQISAKPQAPLIHAIDNSKKMLGQARDNAFRAGVADWIRFELGDARKLEKPNSLIITNPPYGIRLEDETAAAHLLNTFTRQVKHACAPSTLVLVLPEGNLAKSVGFKPDKRTLVKSGTFDLLLLKFDIRAGKFARNPAGTPEA